MSNTLNAQIRNLRRQLAEVSRERDVFENRCDMYESLDGTTLELAHLRKRNTFLEASNTRLLAMLNEAHADLDEEADRLLESAMAKR